MAQEKPIVRTPKTVFEALIQLAREYSESESKQIQSSQLTQEGAKRILDHTPQYIKLMYFLDGMPDYQFHEAMSLMWIGREDGEPDDWSLLMKEAAKMEGGRAYMMGKAGLARYLSKGIEDVEKCGMRIMDSRVEGILR